MKATLALLADRDTANRVTGWAWRLHLRHKTGVVVRRLPPHVSLKQPFDANDLDALEAFFADFARSIAPFSLTLTGWQLWEMASPPSGVLSLAVAENPPLRDLHDHLNRELDLRFGDYAAPFDGADYRFHLTVTAGGGDREAYRQAFNMCQQEPARRTFTAREIALFVYDDAATGEWDYTTYQVLPLGAG